MAGFFIKSLLGSRPLLAFNRFTFFQTVSKIGFQARGKWLSKSWIGSLLNQTHCHIYKRMIFN
jgi:hypothetical protein